MSQQVTLRPAGLYLQPNDLGSVPDGAMSQADNVVISRDGIVEPRPGKVSIATLSANYFINAAWPINFGTDDDVAVHYYDGTYYRFGVINGGSLLNYNILSFTAYNSPSSSVFGSRAMPTIYLPGAVYGNKLYASTQWGVLKLDSTATNILNRAGVPPALDMEYSLNASGTPTAVPNNTQVAYRYLWVRNGVPGAPSPRLVVTNTSGGTRDVDLTITVPKDGSGSLTSLWGLQAGDVLQVYRSVNSGGSAVEPDDELGLVWEETLSSVPGSSIWSVTDTVPDGLLGAALYTNESQQGSLQENSIPPVCGDLAIFRGTAFYANTTERTVDATLYAVGTGQVTTGTTISFDGGLRTITGGGAENLGTDTFQVYTGGTLEQNLRNTAASIIRVINKGTGALGDRTYAISTDVTGQVPGHIRAISKVGLSIGGTASTSGIRFRNNSPVYHKGRLHYSKDGIPDAVPGTNYVDVGDAEAPIARIVGTRDALFIFKDDGLYRLTGTSAPWTVTPFDPTCRLIAVRSAVSLDNSIFALTTQGVVRVTDTGVTVLSRPIETAIQLVSSFSSGASYAHAIADEHGRKYMLWFWNSVQDDPAIPQQAYVYDLFTRAWTRRTDGNRCGTATNLGTVVFGGETTTVWKERRTYTVADYADGTSAIATALAFTPRLGDSPARKHKFRHAGLLFRTLGGTSAALSFATDLVTTPASITYTLSDYGTPPFSPFSLRTFIPVEQSRGSQLTVGFSQNVNGTTFQLQGLSLTYSGTLEEAGY